MTQTQAQQLCYGAQDEHNAPICEGPNVRRIEVTEPWKGGNTFETHWCEDCRDLALADGYTFVFLDAPTQ